MTTSEARERFEVLVHYAVQGAARPRASRRGRDKDKIIVHMPTAHKAAEGALSTTIYLAARAAGWMRVRRPELVAVDVHLVLDRPQAELGRQWPDERYEIGGKPDADNVGKLVMDAATKAGVWDDDAQVWDLRVRRWRVARGEQESTLICFERLVSVAALIAASRQLRRGTRSPTTRRGTRSPTTRRPKGPRFAG